MTRSADRDAIRHDQPEVRKQSDLLKVVDLSCWLDFTVRAHRIVREEPLAKTLPIVVIAALVGGWSWCRDWLVFLAVIPTCKLGNPARLARLGRTEWHLVGDDYDGLNCDRARDIEEDCPGLPWAVV